MPVYQVIQVIDTVRIFIKKKEKIRKKKVTEKEQKKAPPQQSNNKNSQSFVLNVASPLLVWRDYWERER